MKKLKYFILFVMLLIVALSAYGQEPTQIGPGGSWTSARGIINTNMTQVYDSLQSLRYSTNLNYSFIESHADSITAHTAKIALRLLKTDTASMLANYTRNGELAAAIAGKLNVSDTATMLSPYALTSELGDIGTVLSTDDFDEGFVTLWAGPDSIRGTPNLQFTNDNTLTVLGNVYLGGVSTYFGTSSATGALKSRAAGGPSLINRKASETVPVFSVDQSYSTSGIGGTEGTAVGFIINGSSRFMSYQTYNDSKVSLYTPAATSSFAGFRLPHGTAPSSPINGDLWTTTGGLFVHVNSSTDTLATQEYARQYGGTGTVTVSDVQEEIADSLNVLRAAVTVGNGTKAPYFDGSQDGGQILYFYGDNGFYTALQGGAPVANRSYRLPIAALPSAGTTSLMNIDEYGNMGFVASTTYAPTANPTFTGVQKVSTTDTLATKAYARSVGGGGGGVVGIALNSGTITLTGDGGTADDITFYTNGDGSYDLPAGGGNLTIMSQVQGWINDSLDARIGDGVELSTIAVMKADSTGGPGHYASWYDMTTGLTSKVNVSDTTSMLSHYILASEVSSTYAPLSSPNFSGTPLLATSDTLATQAYARSYGGSGTVTTDDVEALITANTRLNVDTIPLFVFGLGSGVAADTAVFNNNAIAGVFYNSGADTLHITSIRGVLSEGSGTETIGVQVSWHTTFKSGSATNLNASAYTVTSITTGDEDTSFANNEIPPGVWVWCTISGVSAGNKPSLLIVTMTGYKIRNW